jgi:hypothetical protein
VLSIIIVDIFYSFDEVFNDHVYLSVLDGWVEGVHVLPERQIAQVKAADGDRIRLQMTDGSNVITDHVVMALGIEPNVDLAQKAGLEIDEKRGGILVNAELEARSNVFVGYSQALLLSTSILHYRLLVTSLRIMISPWGAGVWNIMIMLF